MTKESIEDFHVMESSDNFLGTFGDPTSGNSILVGLSGVWISEEVATEIGVETPKVAGVGALTEGVSLARADSDSVQHSST
jgi:hypothetical protein